jgi:pimeloyl-ACP methyl ester carboxylesterase
MSHEVEAAGIRFHVAEAGTGAPIVPLHGWPQHWYTWRKVVPLLPSEHRVICPDLRGLGWSDLPPGRYGKQTFADDVHALLDSTPATAGLRTPGGLAGSRSAPA